MPIERRWRPFLLLWGVRPGRTWVRLTESLFEARYGVWALRTGVDNLESWTITGPYRWWRAIGLRSSWPFRDFAFDTQARHGLCVRFREPVRFGRVFRASTLTVTVADPEALGAALAAREIPGEDHRRR